MTLRIVRFIFDVLKIFVNIVRVLLTNDKHV